MEETPRFFLLCLFDKGFPAGGTGDLDLAFSSGHPNPGFAGGTAEITVGFPALQAAKELHKFLVFLLPSVHIPGKYPEQGQHHGDVGKEAENRKLCEAADEIQNQSQHAKNPSQLIYAVSPSHEVPDSGAKTLKHKFHLDIDENIIAQQNSTCNAKLAKFKDCLRMEICRSS